MNLEDNAKGSIMVGIDDFLQARELPVHSSRRLPRLISSMRNIYAGILLMYKEKLHRISPLESNDVLVKDKHTFNINENGDIVAVGYGKTTVDVRQIQNRFKQLNIEIDKNLLEKLQSTRNELEHYNSDIKDESLISLIKDAHVLIYDFAHKYLDEEPSEWFGEDQWEQILEIEEIVAKEKEKLNQEINSSSGMTDILKEEIKDSTCPKCECSLIRPESLDDDCPDLECEKCHELFNAEELLQDKYVDHYNLVQGGTPQLGYCPECGREGVIATDDPDKYKCIFCDQSFPSTCERCSTTIPVYEIDCDNPNICSYCCYILSKDD